MHKPHIPSVDDNGLNLSAPGNRSPLKFFLLVFALSIPFWIVGAVIQIQLLPSIPISALMVAAPATAALILVYRENKSAGVKALLKRSFDFNRVKAKIWWVPIILLMPSVLILSYIVMYLMGAQLLKPQLDATTIIFLFALFFIAALGEELGWSGYAIDPLQDRFGALWASLIVGVGWVVWHLIPLLQVPQSLTFIAWWSLGTLAYRVIITWLYNNTGRSVFVAAFFHTMINLVFQLFPVNGSYLYDPRVTGLILAVVAIVVVIVWGPQTMMRTRNARRSNVPGSISTVEETSR
ncbi:MAG: CPBP family intramembrane metalloprotease [Anaerolineales bacterium]|nr:CPBP family intramembrane metalloprotease [Anaerolineales bacterium]